MQVIKCAQEFCLFVLFIVIKSLKIQLTWKRLNYDFSSYRLSQAAGLVRVVEDFIVKH